ncbi:MAG: IS256 family transposase [Saprospiraceae bacterium]|nr:IS256 family transposase [Saprospiraceae bacterium]
MENTLEHLLDALVKEIKDPKDFEKVQDQLLKRGIQSLLKAEMEAHLGYAPGSKPVGDNIRNGYSEKTLSTSQGEITIDIPRDRMGTFEPTVVPKHKTMIGQLDQTINLLYAKGMSNSDIVDFLNKTYGVSYSTSQISVITNRLLEDIKDWQSRPLDSKYAITWIDAIHYKIRHEGKVITKAAMLIIGIGLDGIQDLLGMYIVENESAAAWSQIMTDLRTRGMQDTLFMCSDNLPGLQKAVESSFPQCVHQICIVHQIRNTLKFVSYKDRKAIVSDVKGIYQADNQDMAKIAFTRFKEIWGGKYSSAVKSWAEIWDALTAFLEYPLEIRKLIYTTNMIESFNSSLRKYTGTKKVFPHDDAAIKSIYLALQQIRPKWNKARFNWGQIYNQLYIHFENRILA